ncbi:MAG: Asp-tRNA(Asn)/Glu-tRNA(Gln) amidotransferase GatCAB subunit C [Candidatus Marinimicrobia bacterium CG08_land_8_20_14_0_20_45_22]|nr:MAG: Asp-tRNA(Asn)/Glu-tRNA(Gln) amidotransferase GatCAB subunit C [Candidatus Marinimicrobia bacterium CG08_land_8_20_14_0_20_45_22]
MEIDEKIVGKIAELAKLDLTDTEKLKYAAQIEQILDYVRQLSQVDTSSVQPLSHVHEMTNVFRDDSPAESLSKEDVFRNAPERLGDYFRVPKVIKDINS